MARSVKKKTGSTMRGSVDPVRALSIVSSSSRDDTDVRCDCLEQAVKLAVSGEAPSVTVDRARQFYQFATGSTLTPVTTEPVEDPFASQQS